MKEREGTIDYKCSFGFLLVLVSIFACCRLYQSVANTEIASETNTSEASSQNAEYVEENDNLGDLRYTIDTPINVVSNSSVDVDLVSAELRRYNDSYQVSVVDFSINNKTDNELYAYTRYDSMTIDDSYLYTYNKDNYHFYFNDDSGDLSCYLHPGNNSFKLKYYEGNLFEYGDVISFNVTLFNTNDELVDSFDIKFSTKDIIDNTI